MIHVAYIIIRKPCRLICVRDGQGCSFVSRSSSCANVAHVLRFSHLDICTTCQKLINILRLYEGGGSQLVVDCPFFFFVERQMPEAKVDFAEFSLIFVHFCMACATFG